MMHPTVSLNAKFDRKLYAKLPDGMPYLVSDILEELCARYDLKEPLLLWYKDLKASLVSLGLNNVPSFSSLYIDRLTYSVH